MARARKFYSGASLTVTSNEPAFLAALREYGRRVVEVSGPRAINATIRNVRTRLVKELGQSYALRRDDEGMTPAARIRSLIRTTRARRGQLSAEIAVDFRSQSLKYFQHRATGVGVQVRVLKGGSQQLVRGAFGPPRRGRAAVMGGHIYRRTGVRTQPTRGYWVEWAKLSPKRRVPMRETVQRIAGPSIRGRAAVLFEQWRRDGYLQERLAANIRQEAQGRVSQLRRSARSRGVRL